MAAVYAADALRIVARQASSALPSTTVTPSDPTPTIPISSPTPTGGGGTTQSPLLFFVALGFGVVFTNLWIIVGVKYCFRYNARNRATLLDQAGAGAIDLQDVNAQPRRRRRQRKLLSMVEVERQFPLQKYGVWMRSRRQAGLPAEGGVDGENAKQVVERAQSVRDVEGAIEIVPVSPVSPVTAKHSMEKDTTKTDTSELAAAPAAAHQPIDITTAASPPIQTMTSHEKPTDPHILSKLQTNNTQHTLDPKNPDADHPSDAEHSDDEDEDAIQAIHPDVTDHPGDSCAICIDVLEDDEDVRGLTCGHAFHASCIDPWLTSRRACCPLCKRDYWVPKSCAAGAEGEGPEETPEERRQRRREREALRAASDGQALWTVRGGRFYLPGRLLGGGPVYVREGDGFRNLSPNEIRRRERTEFEREQRRQEERMAASLARRAARDQARQDRQANGGGGWRGLGLFGRGSRNPDPEAQARAAPQNAAEAQLMAQARGQRVGQAQMNGVVLGRLNVFGRSGGGSNAIGAGQHEAARAAALTLGQIEAQNAQPPTRRGWIFR